MLKLLSRLSTSSPAAAGAGILLLRLTCGGMMAVGHGWPKLQKFGSDPSTFPDPLGIGPTLSFAGAIGGELIGATLIAVGLFTRLACLPVMFAMFVAAFIIHKADPLFMPPYPAKEPAILYLAMYACVLMAGPGRYSLDAVFFKPKPPVTV